MEGAIILDTENYAVAGNKTKGEKTAKGSTIGSAPRKSLADISNLPQRNQDAKPQSISLNAKEYIDKLHQENMALVKLLADRNKIIELSAIELQKLRINYQKVQQQNLQLAQANSQMLAELNSGKDRLKALQHELGCKNGLLIARKMESEVITVECVEAGKFSQADEDNIACYTKRKRQSKTLDPTTVNPVQTKDKTDKKRSRRQSARFKSGEQERTEYVFEITDALGPTTIKPVQDEKKVDKKRKSGLCELGEQEQTEDLFETSDAPGPTTSKPVQTKMNVDDKKRLCPRRQSARFKSQEQVQEPIEDSFQIDDAKFPISPRHDDMVHESCPTSSVTSIKIESEVAISDPGTEEKKLRRFSSRPMRQAVEKIQSYREVPLNVKMRRSE